ncbi:MAG: hypothetical protein V2G51_01720 [bacterium JZ-2024 1]
MLLASPLPPFTVQSPDYFESDDLRGDDLLPEESKDILKVPRENRHLNQLKALILL